MCVCVFCAFVGMDNKLYKMHGTYIKVVLYTLLMESTYIYTSLVENVKYHSLFIQQYPILQNCPNSFPIFLITNILPVQNTTTTTTTTITNNYNYNYNYN